MFKPSRSFGRQAVALNFCFFVCSFLLAGVAKSDQADRLSPGQSWRERATYYVLVEQDRRMLTVLNYCQRPGACEKNSGPEYEYFKAYLEGKDPGLERESWEKNVKLIGDVASQAIGAKVAGVAIGKVTEFAAAHPEVFDLSYQHWSSTIQEAKFYDVDLSKATEIIVNTPTKRSFLEGVTASSRPWASFDNQDSDKKVEAYKQTLKVDGLAEKQGALEQQLGELGAKFKESRTALDRIGAGLAMIRNDAARAQRRQQALEEFHVEQANISAGFTLLSLALGTKDPKAARVVQAVGQGTARIMEANAVAKGLLKDPGKLVLMTNIVTAAVAIVQAAQEADNQQKFQEAIMAQLEAIRDQLKELSDKLDKLTFAVNQGFKEVIERLDRIIIQNQRLEDFAIDIRSRLVEVETHVRSLFQAQALSDYKLGLERCVRSLDSPQACYILFKLAAVDQARNLIWSDHDSEFRSAGSLKKLSLLLKSPQNSLNDLNYLASLIRNMSGSIPSASHVPSSLPNIGFWSRAAEDFATVLSGNPALSNDDTKAVSSPGEDFQNFFVSTLGKQEFINEFAKHLSNRYNILANTIEAEFVGAQQQVQQLNLPIFTDNVRSNPTYINVPIKAPQNLRELVPEYYLMAVALGLGRGFDVYYGWAPPGNHILFEISIDFVKTDGSQITIARRNRTSQTQYTWGGRPGQCRLPINHVPRGPTHAMWDSGQICPGGPVVEEALVQNFVQKSTSNLDGKQAQDNLETVKRVVDDTIAASVKNSGLPAYDSDLGAFVPRVVGLAQLDAYADEIHKAQVAALQDFKTFEALVYASHYYVDDMSECLKVLHRLDPDRISRETEGSGGSPASGHRAFMQRARAAASETSGLSSCQLFEPRVSFIQRPLARLRVLEELTKSSAQLIADIKAEVPSIELCPYRGWRRWLWCDR